MVKKKDDLKCAFDPVNGDAIIYKGNDPVKGAVVVGHGLKDIKDDWFNRIQTTQKAGQDYVGTASIPGVGDPTKASATFQVFIMNKESMGCSVPSLGIEAVPAPRVATPAASAPSAPKP